MKKIAALIMMVFLTSTMIFAQRAEVRKANRELSRGILNLAKESIDKAVLDPTTQVDPASWVLKAKIYMEIASSENEDYKNLAENPLDIAREAIGKAKELDINNKNLLEIQQSLLVLSEFYFNSGAIAYNENRYLDASILFENSYKISESFGSTDTSTFYNAGLSAEIGKNPERAIDIYKQVVAMDYNQPFLYSSLTNLEMAKGNVEEAQRWINAGRERYPDNLDLVFTEANLYLTSGNIPEARRVLQIAIDRDPDNANLYYAFGVNYDQMSRDTLYAMPDREFALEEATKAYEKAIEIEPDYFDAIYNLGALHFNEGIRLFVEAEDQLRKDMNFREYEKREAVVKAKWLEAQPYLEHSLEVIETTDPNIEVVLRSLRELYLRTNQDEKLVRINKLWDEQFGDREEE